MAQASEGSGSQLDEDFPMWAIKGMFMIKFGWTERQIEEEISPAMMARLMFLQQALDAQEKANQPVNPRGRQGQGKPQSQGQTGNNPNMPDLSHLKQSG